MKPPSKSSLQTIAASEYRSERSTWGICFLLVVLSTIVFGQTLGHGFVDLDDGVILTENLPITSGINLRGVAYAFTSFDGHFYTPLRVLSHQLDCQLFGLKEGGHHLTNVMLHSLSSILLLLALYRMTGALWRSFFVAAVFAIHPLHVESVAWISERKDTLSGIFFMLTLLVYSYFATKPNSKKLYALLLFVFALGLLSKPSLVTLPAVLLLLDYWPLRRISEPLRWHSVRPLVIEKLPLLILAGGASVLAYIAQGTAVASIADYPLPSRMANALLSYGIYIRQTILPVDLIPFYLHPGRALSMGILLPAVGLLVLVSAAAFMARRHAPYFLIGWLWYIGILLPMIGLIQVGDFAHADRFMYLPQTGLVIAVTWGTANLISKFAQPKAVSTVVAILAIGSLLPAAIIQTSHWKSSETLWKHTLNSDPGNCLANCKVGTSLRKQGQNSEASHHYQLALASKPDYPEVLFNLGSIYQEEGKLDEAILCYEKAIRHNREFVGAYSNLGNVLLIKGQIEQATSYFQQALDIKPDFIEGRINLGNAYLQNGEIDHAISSYEKAVETDPRFAGAHNNLGYAFLQSGRIDESIAEFQKALQIQPALATYQNLGSALLQKGNFLGAISNFQKALEINPNSADTCRNLGLSYAALVEPGKAVPHLKKALTLNPEDVLSLIHLAWIKSTCTDPAFRNVKEALELALRARKLSGDLLVQRTLAAAQAADGNYPEALRIDGSALEEASAGQDPKMAETLRSDIETYSQHKPLRKFDSLLP